jgi:hypothetical protein
MNITRKRYDVIISNHRIRDIAGVASCIEFYRRARFELRGWSIRSKVQLYESLRYFTSGEVPSIGLEFREDLI